MGRELMDKFKDNNLAIQRIKVVKKHAELMELASNCQCDIEDIKFILKELIKITIPVSDLELSIINE